MTDRGLRTYYIINHKASKPFTIVIRWGNWQLAVLYPVYKWLTHTFQSLLPRVVLQIINDCHMMKQLFFFIVELMRLVHFTLLTKLISSRTVIYSIRLNPILSLHEICIVRKNWYTFLRWVLILPLFRIISVWSTKSIKRTLNFSIFFFILWLLNRLNCAQETVVKHSHSLKELDISIHLPLEVNFMFFQTHNFLSFFQFLNQVKVLQNCSWSDLYFFRVSNSAKSATF